MGTTAEVLVLNVPSDVTSLVTWFRAQYGFNVISESRIGEDFRVVYDLASPRMATANKGITINISHVEYQTDKR
ncbi:hypothetical protein PGC34_15865 [Pseudomonas kribbensis]|uniref:hypothetical protein n=1 Tax=Pseudomonas kribbensis TaxID=1628086 RepID=UPI003BF8B3C3